LHTRLKRQLDRHFGDGTIPTGLTPFLDAVDRVYQDSDREQARRHHAATPDSYEALDRTGDLPTLPDQILILDENGVIVECKGGGPGGPFVNPVHSIGKKLARLPASEHRSAMLRAIERCRISGVVETATVEIEGDGATRACEARVFTAADAQVIAILQHRSSNHAPARSVARPEQFLRRILDRSPGYIFVKDRDGRFSVANQAVAAAYGTVPEALVGRTDADFNSNAEEVAAFLEADRRVIDERKELFIPEEPVTEANGHTRWVQTIKVPLIESDGSCNHMLGLSTDITVRRAAELKNRIRSDQILRTHAALEELALTVNLNRSEALARVSRVTVRALGADRVGLLLVSEDHSTLTWSFEHDSDGIGTEQETNWEASLFPRYIKALQDGQMLVVSDVERDERVGELLGPMLGPAGIRSTLDVPIRIKGRLIGVLSAGQTSGIREWTLEDQDLGASIANFASATLETARRDEVEEQLRQSQKMEAIGLLAGGVAHDFNNLLTVILGYAEMATDGLEKGHPAVTDLKQITTAAGRATELTRSLLTFSRKHVLEVKVVDVATSILAFHTLLARIMGEDLEVVTSGLDLPLFVMGDRSQLDQVLLNLATNARQAMPDGGELRIHLRECMVSDAMARHRGLERGGQFAQISVEDTGDGMSPQILTRIWEPFFTTKQDGTGLGLSLAYGIVESHGGFITADSQPGVGSIFRLHLPLTTSERLTESSGPSEPHLSGNETILLAEDESSLRQLLAASLGKLGYRVIQATDGEEAISQARQHPELAAVIMDVVMPRTSGTDAFEHIRQALPGIPALFISGYAPESSQLGSFLQESNTDLLSKPFVVADVAERLRSLLDLGSTATAQTERFGDAYPRRVPADQSSKL